MHNATEHLKTITTEQLQHGDVMAPSNIMPAAAASLVAQTFFEFVAKHKLAETMVSMSAQQIQVIAIFLSNLQRKPPKRVHISERLFLIQQKPSYTPADQIASPEVPHFARPQADTDDCIRVAVRFAVGATVECLVGRDKDSGKDQWVRGKVGSRLGAPRRTTITTLTLTLSLT